jgi:hypothetical protein
MLIKSVTSGKMKPVAVNAADPKNYAKAFRGTSNMLQFMKSEYNSAHVLNTTPKNRQVIFMDAQFNADFDVDVLSAAFNMDKADFMGSLFLVDDWTTFDNSRWEVIRANSDGVEEVTAAELTLMQSVKAIVLDEEWFQIYDNLNKFTEKFIASGLRWNYFYHTWKTVSFSPFANAVVFVLNTASIANPANVAYTVEAVDDADFAKVITLIPADADTLGDRNMVFVQTQALTELGVAVQPYGAIFVPSAVLEGATTSVSVQAKLGADTYSATVDLATVAVGDTVTLAK